MPDPTTPKPALDLAAHLPPTHLRPPSPARRPRSPTPHTMASPRTPHPPQTPNPTKPIAKISTPRPSPFAAPTASSIRARTQTPSPTKHTPTRSSARAKTSTSIRQGDGDKHSTPSAGPAALRSRTPSPIKTHQGITYDLGSSRPRPPCTQTTPSKSGSRAAQGKDMETQTGMGTGKGMRKGAVTDARLELGRKGFYFAARLDESRVCAREGGGKTAVEKMQMSEEAKGSLVRSPIKGGPMKSPTRKSPKEKSIEASTAPSYTRSRKRRKGKNSERTTTDY